MRVTTSSMINRYTSRLNSVLSNMNSASMRVTSGRKYDRASQDPTNSVKSAKLRREHLKNDNYITNVQDVKSQNETVESSLMKISKMAEDAYVDVLSAVNGTMGPDERMIYASKLREMQQTMVKDLNTSHAGKFVFGGSSTNEPPFNLSDTGVLTYRGLDVNSTDPAVQAQLNQMANETLYIDLGFGLDVTADGVVNSSSAYNTAMPGINFLGFGLDANGNPNNLISTLGRLADEFENGTFNENTVKELSNKLDVQRKTVLNTITELGSNNLFLENTEDRLKNNQATYNKKIDATEFIPLDKAIMNFKALEYTYQAALKVGMSILSPSFIDFMR